MNNAKTEIKRWGIVVIQSLGDKDIKTGEQLFNDILRFKQYCQKESFASFYDVHSVAEFEDALKCTLKSLNSGDIVTLQIEAHGNDNGIVLSNGEIVSWKHFYDLIRPINIEIGHLLIVVMAMCKSIAMISSIDPLKRAPYRAFICTTRDVTAEEIVNAFSAFYQEYFNLLDIVKAMHALQCEVVDSNGYSPFQLLSAECVFDETFSDLRNVDSLAMSHLIREDKRITTSSLSQKAEELKHFLKKTHDISYNYYNFKDLY
jgi:hypothetical protein